MYLLPANIPNDMKHQSPTPPLQQRVCWEQIQTKDKTIIKIVNR